MAIGVHDDKYDYSETVYVGGKYSSRLRTHVKNAGGEIPISEHLRGFLTESTTLENLTLLLKDVSDFKI